MPYFDLLNAVARVVGGTQPAAAQSSVVDPSLQPYWYSGVDTGDSTGVPGLAGCFSVPSQSLHAAPVGMVLQGPWAPDATLSQGPRQGRRFTVDTIHVRIMVGHDAEAKLMGALANFRDVVPAAFDAHMQLFASTGVTTAWCESGDFIEVEWAGNVYFALVFMVSVQRALSVTYTG